MSRFLRWLSFPALLLLVAGAAGCGSEERYCDDTGCYYCDGLGCRPIDGDPEPDAAAPGCTDSDECGDGFACTGGECRAEDDVCQFNHECSGGRLCVDGRCVAECADDGDCPGDGQVCEGEVCRCPSGDCGVDDHPEPFCTGDDQCQPGHPCVGGICRTPCEEHADCQRFDVQFNYCLDGYCATTNEVTTDCALSIDCPDGEDCIDGICR
ncbi:MAG: hypothetical protein ACODAU_07320 [Myxococcota bacterium]